MKAFPHTYDQIIDGHVATCTNYGMDLRDWFAGLAMQSMNSRPDYEDVPCLLYTSPSPRDRTRSRMPSSA